VDRPDVPHYTQGAIQPMDYIRGLGDAEFAGACIQNVLKYITRYRYKGTPIQDLEKARTYIDFMLERERDRATE